MATSPRMQKQVWADTTSNRPVIVGPWMLKHGVGTLRFTDEMRAEEGTFTQTLGYRYAQVSTDFPGAWTVTATTRTADGAGTTDIDVSATTDQMWVQAALFGKSGGAMAGALSTIQVQTNADSRIVAARSLDLQAVVNTSEFAYLELGKPFPALGLSSLMFVVQLFGVEGTSVTFRPIWRTFEARLDAPGSWANLDSGQTVTADTFYNSGSEAVTPGTVQFAQVGMKISGTAGRGTLRATVAGLF
jgi:hypothetical protein